MEHGRASRGEAFERASAEFCGVRHALGVANGTAALHLALLAAGCGPGDEVVLPSLNFVAAANAIDGMTALTWDRHRGHAHSYDVVEHGFNYRLDEIRAAMGLVQLRRLPEENAARARISASYRTELDGRQGVSMPFGGAETDASSHHLAVVLLPGGASRNEVRTALADAGVQSSMHYPQIHQFSRFAELGSRRPCRERRLWPSGCRRYRSTAACPTTTSSTW